MFRSNWLYYIALGVILLAAVPALSQEPIESPVVKHQNDPAPQNPEHSSSNDGSAQEECQEPERLSPVLSDIVDAVQDLVEQQREQQAQPPQEYEIRDLKAQEEMAFWAYVMAIAAGVTVLLTGVGIHLLKKTLDATNTAIDQSEKATNAAERSVDVAANAADRQLRAYVHVEWVRLEPVGQTKEWAVVCSIKNFGQTPAKRCFVRIELVFDGSNANIQFLPSSRIKEKHIGSVPPSMFMDTSAPVKMSDNWIKFKEGALNIYAFGRIEYQDMTGERRATWFRLEKTHGPETGFALCPYGNYHT